MVQDTAIRPMAD